MDLRYSNGSDIYCVRACYGEDASDLIAIAGDNTVEVLSCDFDTNAVEVLATFNLGLRSTALAFSLRTVSPKFSDSWIVELAVSTHDFGLHLCTISYNESERVYHFGGGLTGHHERINDLSFVGGSDTRHLASVSDDRNLIVWDLFPSNADEALENPGAPNGDLDDVIYERPQPTALVIRFSAPLTSVSSHPSTSKQLVISDSRGSVFLIDWRKDPTEDSEDEWRGQSIMELLHPKALAQSATNLTGGKRTGFASWRRDNANIIVAVFGSSFAIWDMTVLRGGKPHATGSIPCNGTRVRWSPTLPEYFALSSSISHSGASVEVCNISYLHAQPISIMVSSAPHRMLDFDWLAAAGIPRIVATVGPLMHIFPISLD